MNKKFCTLLIASFVTLSASVPLFADGKKDLPPSNFAPKDIPSRENHPQGFAPDMKYIGGKERKMPGPNKDYVFKTIEGKVKVSGTKSNPIYFLETSDGKYAADVNLDSPEAQKILEALKDNKNKKITVSGFLNVKTQIFKIETLGTWEFYTEPINPANSDLILK